MRVLIRFHLRPTSYQLIVYLITHHTMMIMKSSLQIMMSLFAFLLISLFTQHALNMIRLILCSCQHRKLTSYESISSHINVCYWAFKFKLIGMIGLMRKKLELRDNYIKMAFIYLFVCVLNIIIKVNMINALLPFKYIWINIIQGKTILRILLIKIKQFYFYFCYI